MFCWLVVLYFRILHFILRHKRSFRKLYMIRRLKIFLNTWIVCLLTGKSGSTASQANYRHRILRKLCSICVGIFVLCHPWEIAWNRWRRNWYDWHRNKWWCSMDCRKMIICWLKEMREPVRHFWQFGLQENRHRRAKRCFILLIIKIFPIIWKNNWTAYQTWKVLICMRYLQNTCHLIWQKCRKICRNILQRYCPSSF